jgi:hypothetical protein
MEWRPGRKASGERGLCAEAGDGLELQRVRGGRAQGEGGAVPGDQGDGEIEVGEVALVAYQSGFGADAGVVLGEQHADVVAAEGVVGSQRRGFGSAHGRKQEDEAGEMARAELHGATFRCFRCTKASF